MTSLATNYFFFALTFWVSAEAATDFACLLAVLLRKILDAADATFLPVVSFGFLDCVSADAATAFSALDADLLRRTFEAAEDTLLLVVSAFAMDVVSLLRGPRNGGPTRRQHVRFAFVKELLERSKASNLFVPYRTSFAAPYQALLSGTSKARESDARHRFADRHRSPRCFGSMGDPQSDAT